MSHDDIDPQEGLLMQALRAAGAEDGLAYVACAETTGQRELRLMLELDCGRDDLLTRFWQERRSRVILANAAAAESAIQRARRLWPHLLVPNHVGLDIPGWGKDQYSGFKKRLVEQFAVQLVLGPDWTYSRGERVGVAKALEEGMPIFDLRGRRVEAPELRQMAEMTDQAIRDRLGPAGRGEDEIRAIIPDIAIG